MKQGRPSDTARIAALLRAAHLVVDGKPRLLEDNLAGHLAGVSDEASLRNALGEVEDTLAAWLPRDSVKASVAAARAAVLWRSRFVEDTLESALHRGVRQYVILGAGLDSSAYRCAAAAPALRIFEVDHPSTQNAKLDRLHSLGISPPTGVSFVAIDFESEPLLPALARKGFQCDEPALFSWTGVVLYLTREAFGATLTQLSKAAPGSEIVFDYTRPSAVLDGPERQIMGAYEAFVRSRGEPCRNFLSSDDLAADLVQRGFRIVENVGPDEGNRRYFANRSDGISLGADTCIMRVQVP